MTSSKKIKKETLRQAQGKKLVILLDVHALLHRAYHALPDFETKSGEPTGALYGLSTMVVKLATDFKPDHVIACYDLPEKTHRHKVYEAYKATRAKIDDALVTQIISSRELFETFDIPIYESPGFEADDILGTIVDQTKEQKDISIVIASGDMDTLQLVDNKKVQVFTLKKGITDTVMYDEAAVLKRFDFVPLLLPDYKGLRGDASDNIIGVPGIGEKTASILISKFGTLENIFKMIKSGKEEEIQKVGITPRIIGLLKEHEEEALFSKMLATIRRDAPIEFKLPEHTFKEGINMERIEKLFSRLEFRVLGQRFKSYSSNEGVGNRKEEIEEKSLVSSSRTRGPNIPPLEPKQSSNTLGPRMREDDSDLENTLPQELAIAVHLLNSSILKPKKEDLFEITGKDTIEDAGKEATRLIKEYELTYIYDELEKPLISIIDKMEKRGIKVDVPYLEDLSKKYHSTLSGLEKSIWGHGGDEFNINSPKQLGEILFGKLNLQVKGLKKTAGGAQSTRESELAKLVDAHPIIPLILEYRELNKLLTTYIDVIPKMVDQESRLHAHFIQTGAATGRMASSDPNLQNIPIKSELGRNIRKGFVAEKGFMLGAFDYSQIELRIAAILSGDEKLIDIFKKGHDVHAAVAAQMYRIPEKVVTSEMRRKAKVINFGILYGMGVNALKTNLGGTRDEAKKFYDEYFATFTTLASFLERVKRDARGQGYTKTLWGRRRYFPEINSKLPFLRASAERMAINAPIQGSQADLIKKAMVKIDEYITREKLEDKVYLMLQVHDEVIYEIKEEIKDKVAGDILNIMKESMSKEDAKGVPILADGSLGKDWGNMKEIE